MGTDGERLGGREGTCVERLGGWKGWRKLVVGGGGIDEGVGEGETNTLFVCRWGHVTYLVMAVVRRMMSIAGKSKRRDVYDGDGVQFKYMAALTRKTRNKSVCTARPMEFSLGLHVLYRTR